MTPVRLEPAAPRSRVKHSIPEPLRSLYIIAVTWDFHKVGRSKPPPVLTGGFNWLKPPWSICQKVVNTGQYESEWSIENFKGPF